LEQGIGNTAGSAAPKRATRIPALLLIGGAALVNLCAICACPLIAISSLAPRPAPTLDQFAIGTAVFATALQASVETVAAMPTVTATPAIPEPTSTARPVFLDTRGIEGASCIPSNPVEMATVVEIVDGDTIRVRLERDGKTYPLRYIGIDTPEMNPAGVAFAAEARDRNVALALGRTAALITDTSDLDQYGRLLRYVVVGDKFVNYEMVASGDAIVAAYPPDTACIPAFEAAAANAAALSLGIWAAPVVPLAMPTLGFRPVPPPSGGSGACNCNGPDLDCAHFSSHAEAQACYEGCLAWYGDKFRLDGDNDGSACEALP
jgi:micrococcal nuclease